MSVRFARERDRLHVFTDRVEWTILKRFQGSRGPCYISDVRTPGGVLVNDPRAAQTAIQPLSAHTINDPRQGGLFGFGLVAARPPDDIQWRDYKPDDFWQWGWELTTRLDGTGGFGVARPRVEQTGPYRANASCELVLDGQPVLALKWAYKFTDRPPRVDCFFTVLPTTTGEGLWVKEPKIVANCLTGWRSLEVADLLGKVLTTSRGDGPLVDLARYRDPRLHTKQIPQPDRFSYKLQAPQRRALTIVNNNGLQRWAADANLLPPMTSEGTPAYCLRGDEDLLWSRTEVPRWDALDVCGIVMHGWEGGYGAPDCLACFRPWPELGKAYNARLSATIGS